MSRRPPLLGYNHNVRHAGRVFHVQTEDYGVARPVVVTQIFFQGSILASARTPYPPEAPQDSVVRIMQAQHKQLLRRLRDGGVEEPRSAVLRATEEPAAALGAVADHLSAALGPVEAQADEPAPLPPSQQTVALPGPLASLVDALIPLDDPRAAEDGTPLSSDLMSAARLLRRVAQAPLPARALSGSPAAPLSVAVTTPNSPPSFSLALDDLSERTEVSLSAPLHAPASDTTVPVQVPIYRPSRLPASSDALPRLGDAGPQGAKPSRGTAPRLGVAAYMGAVETPASWSFPTAAGAGPPGGGRSSSPAVPQAVADRPLPPAGSWPARPALQHAAPAAPAAEAWVGPSALSDDELSELINLAELGDAAPRQPASPEAPLEDSGPVVEILAEPPSEEELAPAGSGVLHSQRIPRLPSQITPQMAQLLGGLRSVRARPSLGSGVRVLPPRVVQDAVHESPVVAPVEAEETQAHPLTGRAAPASARLTRPGRPRLDGLVQHSAPTAEGVMLRPSFARVRSTPPAAPRSPVSPEALAAPRSYPPQERSLDQLVLEYLAEEVSGRNR